MTYDRLDWQEQTIQQIQDDVLQIWSVVQAVVDQMNDLSFKFFTMFAEWQQQTKQQQQSSLVQD